ncbi:P-loop NTPase [Candidatus Neomarinimicrobiota bacterium]
MKITHDKIIEVLKSVNYPGFNRDIVSFGMVTDIEISGKDVKVVLAVATSHEEHKTALIATVKSALSKQVKAIRVDVEIIQPQPKDGSPAPSTPGEMPARSDLPGVKTTIAIASGKGGVGKSTIAVNLAAAMSMTGASIGILDLDIYGPSLPMILGSQEQPVLNAEQKIVPLDCHGMQVMSFGFISGNQAPTIWRGPLVAKMTQQFFEDVAWGELDCLVLDLPPGTGDIQLTLVQQLALTGAVIVTTPQKLALLDVQKGADMFQKVNTPVLGVIENMSGLLLDGIIKNQQGDAIPDAVLELEGFADIPTIKGDEQGRFHAALPVFRSGGGDLESQRLQVPLLGQIPLSPDLVVASDVGEPYVLRHPESVVGREFRRIAEALLNNTNIAA